MEPIQSPQKKFKNIESSQDRTRKAAKKLRKMSIREQCLMVERAIYVNKEFEDLLAQKEGSSSQGGGTSPSIAARSP